MRHHFTMHIRMRHTQAMQRCEDSIDEAIQMNNKHSSHERALLEPRHASRLKFGLQF